MLYTFIKNVKNTHNHSSKLVEKRVKMAEQEAVENAARNPTLTCRAVMAEIASTLQTDSMAAELYSRTILELPAKSSCLVSEETKLM